MKEERKRKRLKDIGKQKKERQKDEETMIVRKGSRKKIKKIKGIK